MSRQSANEIDQLIRQTRPTNRDLVRRDVIQATQSNVSSLRLDAATYRYPNGTTKELLRLQGTVLCRYRGNQYNIPIEIWLQQDHPIVAPIAYVKPTSDMHVSTTSGDVRIDGTVIIPYLRNWRHPTSDLSHLLNAMSEAFSQTPPVYSAPTSTAVNHTPYPTTATPYPLATTPYPSATTPYPPMTAASMPMPERYNGMSTGSSTSHSYPYGYPQTEIPADIYRASLLSAVQSKLTNRLRDTIQMSNAQIDSLRKTQEDLSNGGKTLQSLIRDMQQQQTDAENHMKNIRVKTNAILDSSSKTSSGKENSVEDDAVIVPAPIYRQLLQAYAEEHAIQDLLYYLAEGLRRESIGLDTYLKRRVLKENGNASNSSDGLYFKSDGQLNADSEDRLTLLYREGIKKQAMEVEAAAEKKQTYEIFEFDDKVELNENIPGVNMGFLDRLFHQLTRKPPSESDYYSDDVFENVEPREVRAVFNSYTSTDEPESTYEPTFMDTIRSFIDDIVEEADVIRGVIDETVLADRRKRRAQSISSSTNSGQVTSF
ncbi:unnamed protein product [Adineta ricciae]|uniref:UEV domain-containing protein n=1 Tax=Adineta ricciae TaxID=249248 RepID=A0A815YGN1_ADIRI|nr:unnamed protein product [Adineta ricciae]